jgi:hypothetical protein
VSEPTHPWWASVPEPSRAGRSGAEAIDDADPVEAFRAARRPQPVPPRAARRGVTQEEPSPQPQPAPEAEGEGGVGAEARTEAERETGTETGSGSGRVDEGLGPPSSHRPELCGICPLCTLARALEDSRPELLEHLTEAARHLAAAARSLLDPATTDAWDAASSRPPGHGATGRARGGVERIRLDPRGADDTGGGRGGAT